MHKIAIDVTLQSHRALDFAAGNCVCATGLPSCYFVSYCFVWRIGDACVICVTAEHLSAIVLNWKGCHPQKVLHRSCYACSFFRFICIAQLEKEELIGYQC